MHNLKRDLDLAQTAAVSVSAAGAFSAATFFSILRDLGANPRLHNGGVYCDTVTSAAVTATYRWANQQDADGRHRHFYAREIWTARPPGVQTVTLG